MKKNELETLKDLFKPPKNVPKDMSTQGIVFVKEEAVRKWIQAWIKHAEEKMGVPQKLMARSINFKDDDVFFFTNCNDIVDKDLRKQSPEETYRMMYQRKSWHMLKLFLQNLIDDKSDVDEGWKHCGHCGKDRCELKSLNGLGHYNRCPDCGRIQLVVYEDNFDKAIEKFKSIKR